MLAVIALFTVALASFRAPGLAVAGLFFGYATGTVVGNPAITTYYTIAVLGVLGLRAVLIPPRLRLNALDLSFAVFLFWYFSTSAFMVNPQFATAAGQGFLLSAGAAYLIARIVGTMGEPEHRLQELCVGLCLMGGVAGFETILSGAAVNGRWIVGEGTAVGVAQSFPFAAIAGLGLLLMPEKRRLSHILIGLLGLGIGAYVTLLSGTRGNLLVIAAAGLLMIAMGHKALLFRLAGLAILVIVIVSIWDFDTAAASIGRLFDFASYGSSNDFSSSVRLQYFARAYEMWQQSPLFGQGIGAFTYTTGAPYPHNMFLELAAEAGLIGVALCLVFLMTAYRRILRLHLLNGWAGKIFLACVAGGLVQQQVSLSIGDAKSIFMLGLVAGFAAMKATRPADENTAPMAA